MKILTLDSNEEVIVIDEEVVEEEMRDDALSAEEIASLKELAAVVPQLLELVKEPVADEDEEINDEEENEEVQDEDEDETINDSFESIGATHKGTKKSMNDAEERQLDIESAWDKRLRGGK